MDTDRIDELEGRAAMWEAWKGAHSLGIQITICDEGIYGFSVDARYKPCDDCGRNGGKAYWLVKTLDEVPAAVCRAVLTIKEASDD